MDPNPVWAFHWEVESSFCGENIFAILFWATSVNIGKRIWTGTCPWASPFSCSPVWHCLTVSPTRSHSLCNLMQHEYVNSVRKQNYVRKQCKYLAFHSTVWSNFLKICQETNFKSWRSYACAYLTLFIVTKLHPGILCIQQFYLRWKIQWPW